MPIATTDQVFYQEQLAWLDEQFTLLTDSIEQLTPAQTAERWRYLPEALSSMPGPFRYDVTPYWEEVVNCCDPRSPVRELSILKGAQVGATVAVLENVILFYMVQIKTLPVMMVTADAGLAAQRMEKNITPMLQESNLMHLIQSIDTFSKRKTGKRNDLLEWVGGGSLTPLGSLNANKFRSNSFPIILEDEIDAYPEDVNKQGDTLNLIEARAKGYWEKRKIIRLSTPLVKGQSKIEEKFLEGDQRYYFVPCKSCGKHQRLIFQGTHDDGEKYGLVWKMKDDRLVPGSVCYRCKYCGHAHKNSDKVWLFKRGEWRPTAEPIEPGTRSYHLSGMYSPPGNYSWEAGVVDYLKAYDVNTSRVKDFKKFQEFYNNFLGKTFELRGDRVQFVQASSHRRIEYKYGQIPNTHAVTHCAYPITLLTMAVDVHKDNLAVAVMGWTRGKRCYLIDYWRFEGDTHDPNNADTWGRLANFIDEGTYEDSGRLYRPALTLVDAGYNNEMVTGFCAQWSQGVLPIVGRDSPAKNQRIQEFGEFKTQLGTRGFRVMVDFYKDRWSTRLRRNWDGIETMPDEHFNAPVDTTDKQLRELTREVKREKVDKRTGRRLGFEWHRPGNAPQELWDLLIYNSAALDLICYDVCLVQFGSDHANWPGFWDYAEGNSVYFERIGDTNTF